MVSYEHEYAKYSENEEIIQLTNKMIDIDFYLTKILRNKINLINYIVTIENNFYI